MTQDQIIQMLRKVIAENQNYTTWTLSTPHLVELVNHAINEEREACAKVAENGRFLHDDSPEARFGKACAAAIRARGQS
jgi:hypothetical protein